MNIVQKTIDRLDRWQQRHKSTAFAYAVIKKYGDDQAGYQAALVTYYGFLSLFPLLLILTTVGGVLGHNNPEFGRELVDSVSSYFPVVGKALDDSVRGISKNGPALIIGLLFVFYGARGIADAFRHAVNHIWHVPIARRSGFPRSWIRSFALIIGGGLGFVMAPLVAGWAAAAGHGFLFRTLSISCNFIILYAVFVLIFRLSLPLKMSLNKFRLSAVISAAGITILQLIGVTVLRHESEHLANTYSAIFATTLGLMAWIYLQTQVVMYAVEVATVKDGKLWPRSLTDNNQTEVDRVIKKKREA